MVDIASPFFVKKYFDLPIDKNNAKCYILNVVKNESPNNQLTIEAKLY
jgi:hypothetical protein